MISVRKAWLRDDWLWTCDICHYGYNIPWEETSTWTEAMAEVWDHIRDHRRAGMEVVWRTVRITR